MVTKHGYTHSHTHINTALKKDTPIHAGSTEILEKSCLREKQHYHGDTLFVEDIKCVSLHCLCVGEQHNSWKYRARADMHKTHTL